MLYNFHNNPFPRHSFHIDSYVFRFPIQTLDILSLPHVLTDLRPWVLLSRFKSKINPSDIRWGLFVSALRFIDKHQAISFSILIFRLSKFNLRFKTKALTLTANALA